MFVCPIQRYAVCFPIKRSDRIEGHLALCHTQQAFSKRHLDAIALATEAIASLEEQAEQQRALMESIQPRCLALSTVHTIHRLISSTLNLNELLPRVVRLCCQVLRAQRGAIWLVAQDGKRLDLKAYVDTQKQGQVLGSSRDRKWPTRRVLKDHPVGRSWLGRVASTCKAYLTPRTMAVPLIEEECVGILMVQRSNNVKPFSPLDKEILTTLSEQAVVAIRNAQMYETQERVTWGTIRSLSAILDGMDPYAPSRSSRKEWMKEVALAIAQEMRIPLKEQRSIEYAALLHDAGRLGIPEAILRKPAKLDPAEFDLVKEHTVKGAHLLQPLEILEPAIPIILHHHERYDGTGYPKGLKGDEIPMGARILAVANAFEAMVTGRPYRKAMSVEEAAKEIASHAGTQFDPHVVEAFLKVIRNEALLKRLTVS
jgi:HD-GYP domain-containing protein (c-di-GMP phosphodiesterase class II)